MHTATHGPFSSGLQWQLVLSLGPSLAEFSYHQHMAAWLKVEQGRKVVMTQPHHQTPRLAMLARPPSEILAELLEEGQEEDSSVAGDANTRVCVMEGGDVLWLPAMQWHATLNLADDTVAVGGQVTSYVQRDRWKFSQTDNRSVISSRLTPDPNIAQSKENSAACMKHCHARRILLR
jgi:hypothetical protein